VDAGEATDARSPRFIERAVLFSDIEGSTERWDADPDAMRVLLQHHDRLIATVVGRHHGLLVHGTGDGAVAAFAEVSDAAFAALDLQDELTRGPEATGLSVEPLRVRIGLHRGVIESRDGDLYGPLMHRCARIMAAGHGGQTMVSRVVADDLRSSSRSPVQLVDRGVHRLKGFHEPEAIAELLRPGAAAGHRALRTENAVEGWLPAIDDDLFVGRDVELAAVERKLESGRLVTLVGTGGVGKTRLAVHVAYRARSSFPDGVWFVDLAAITEPSRVVSSIADALGVADESADSLVISVRRALAERRALLVLDNCEHLLDAVCAALAALRSDTAHAALICTSQRDLGLPGEQVIHVAPLSFDGDVRDSPAGQLFVERALLARPDFVPDDEAMQHIGRICEQLEGLPLAIELAAARVRVMNVASIADRLASTLELLRTRDNVDRHQTLDATIAWSVALLHEADRVTLFDLSIFNASFDWRAAAAVSDQPEPVVLDSLDELVRRSLLVRAGEHFRLLAPMRRYCRTELERSDRAPKTGAQHARWMRNSVPAPLDHIDASVVAARMNLLVETIDDLQSARVWMLEHDPPEAARLSLDLVDFWNTRSRGHEAMSWLSECDTDEVPAELRVELLGWIAGFGWTIGRNEEGEKAARRALELAAASGLALPTMAATRLAVRLAFSNQTAEALALAAEVEREVRSGNGDASRVFGSLAVVIGVGGDTHHAVQLVDEAIADARSVGVVRLLSAIANRLLIVPSDAASDALSAEAAELARAIGRTAVLAHTTLATAQRRLQDGDTSAFLCGVAEFCDLMLQNEPTSALAALQFVPEAAVEVDPRVAAELLAALEALAERHDHRGTLASRDRRAEVGDRLLAILGPDEFKRAGDEGRALSLSEAVDLLHWLCAPDLAASSTRSMPA
jgi:predicted ATPase/class 3 adenylate cyclase